MNPAMPKKLDPIVAKLLAKDPTQRYASAEQLQEALEDWAAIRPGDGGQRRPKEVAVGDCRRRAAGADRRRPGVVEISALQPRPPAGGSTAAERQPGATKDSIILADFINHTGDPVFDTTLNQALQIDLEQSPVIKIVSAQHLAQSVKYLGKPEGTPVTPEIAREIGVREGIKAILTGTIANLGKEYVITLTAQNTATGDEIVSEQAKRPTRSMCWTRWAKRPRP